MQRMRRLIYAGLAMAALQGGCGGSDAPAPAPAATPAPKPAPALTPDAPAAVEPPAAPAAPAPAMLALADKATPSRPPITADSPEALEAAIMTAWRKLPDAGRDNLDIDGAIALATQLQNEGPNGIMPLLDLLASNPGNPYSKMLVVMATSDFIAPKYEARLIELTQPGGETTGRVCAANLLCLLDSPAARERAHALLDDAERRVRIATALALLRQDDEAAISKLPAIVSDPDLSSSERQELIFAMPDSVIPDNLPFFISVLNDQNIVENARYQAARILGALGDKETLARLEAALTAETIPTVRDQIVEAMNVIRTREGMPPVEAPAEAAPAETPAEAPAQ